MTYSHLFICYTSFRFKRRNSHFSGNECKCVAHKTLISSHNILRNATKHIKIIWPENCCSFQYFHEKKKCLKSFKYFKGKYPKCFLVIAMLPFFLLIFFIIMLRITYAVLLFSSFILTQEVIPGREK